MSTSKDAELVQIAADAREAGSSSSSSIAREAIRLPPQGEGCVVIASVSGGKDSTALILALREAQIPCLYVFADTGWEADETYDYLMMLEQKLSITIERVRADAKTSQHNVAAYDERGRWSAAIDRFFYRAGFPGRISRFCTRELKLEPLRKFHDQVEETHGKETVSAIVIRAAESERRSQMSEWEDEGPNFTRHRWGGYVWRPLINWTVEDVLLIHRRHGVPVNPLYQKGHDRVGCYPCIFSNKDEIRMIAEQNPERIDLIERLERDIRVVRTQRNEEEPGRYKHADDASFFQTQRKGFSGIRKVVEWANTDYGGKQMQIFAPAPKGGCMKWGLCDLQLPDGDEEGATSIAPPVPSPDERRFFTVSFDHVSYAIVARDREHCVQILRDHYRQNLDDNYDEQRERHGEPDVVELTYEQAMGRSLFDDKRYGGRYPFTTFEMGALASSEY